MVGTVANLRPVKGYPDLLAAAARVIEVLPDTRFVAVGQGPQEAEIRALHARLGLGERVKLLGYRRDAVRVIGACDVFCLASRHEGLPVALMEALALGLPVVATGVGGVTEVVDDGVEGLLVAPGRPDLLAAALLEVLGDADRRHHLAEAAARRGAALSIERAVRRTEAVYEELTSGSHGSPSVLPCHDAPMLDSYLVGAGAAAVGFIPVGWGSAAVRARRLPTWTGPPARLAEIVVGLAIVVGVSQVLGTLGVFQLLSVTLGLATVGATVGWSERRATSSRGLSSNEPPSVGARHRSREALVVLGAAAVVMAGWFVRTSDALAHGIVELESLRYHLPKAARFVQLESLTSIHHIDVSAGGSLIPYYPDTSSLLHALGILFVGSDLLSPLLNLGFLALALLGGWCVGRPYGAAPVSMLGALLVLGTPQLVSGQPGSAANDVVGIALVLAAVASLVTADSISGARAFAPLCIAALACGLALGVKYTFIAVVGGSPGWHGRRVAAGDPASTSAVVGDPRHGDRRLLVRSQPRRGGQPVAGCRAAPRTAHPPRGSESH